MSFCIVADLRPLLLFGGPFGGEVRLLPAGLPEGLEMHFAPSMSWPQVQAVSEHLLGRQETPDVPTVRHVYKLSADGHRLMYSRDVAARKGLEE